MNIFDKYFENLDQIHQEFLKQFDDYLKEQLRPYGIIESNLSTEGKRVHVNTFGTAIPFVSVHDVFIDNDYKFSIRVSEHPDVKNAKSFFDFERFISKSF